MANLTERKSGIHKYTKKKIVICAIVGCSNISKRVQE